MDGKLLWYKRNKKPGQVAIGTLMNYGVVTDVVLHPTARSVMFLTYYRLQNKNSC